MTFRHQYRADKVFTHTPEFVGNCYLCHAPIPFGKAEYVRDHTSALRSSMRAPARKCHKGTCADRLRRMLDRMAPTLQDWTDAV